MNHHEKSRNEHPRGALSRWLRWLAAPILILSSPALRCEEAAFSIVVAQPTQTDQITTTGRAVPLRTARVGARLSGHIAEWGKGPDGQPLEDGCPVNEGQMLFRLQTDTFADRVHVAEAALKLAEAQLSDLRAWTREERREVLRATVQEVDARLTEGKRDEERFRRLVEDDKTMPLKRLEEIQLQIQVLEAQRRAASAQLQEAERGPTPTQLAVSEAQLSQARAHLQSAQLDLRDTVVMAPFSGVITRRFKSVGDYVTNAPFTEVLELTSQQDLEAELRLPEKYYRRILPGQTRVLLRSPLLTTELNLPVARIIPEIDSLQSTFAFRLSIPAEARGQLAPGAFLLGVVFLSGASQAAIVPSAALVVRDGRTEVFVVEGSAARLREVQVGDRLSEGVIVNHGLQPGDRVVVGAGSDWHDGHPLRTADTGRPSGETAPTPEKTSP